MMIHITLPGGRSVKSSALAALVLIGLLVQAAASQAAPKAKDSRELQAREAFATGRYQEAIDLFGKLYAEKLHPTYLRNIGRCYQNLNEPDRAASSFREYLRKAKDMPADERAEVEGYIKEMEDLQKQNAAAADAARPVPQPLPVAPPVNPVAQPQPALYLQQPAPAPEPAPIYKRAWFWSVVAGVVVAGTVAGLAAGGVFSKKNSNNCPTGYNCLQ